MRAAIAAARSQHELRFRTHWHFDDSLPPARANRIHVQKVLLNLLNNCIEAMEEAGIEKPSVFVRAERMDGNFVRLTIRDNGPGFKRKDIGRLFEPFFTTKAKGIGMGLAISRSLVEANGGQLWLDPMEDSGGTFHLTLPCMP